MESVQFGTAPLGMDNVSIETALSVKTMRDILNFDVANTGTLESRAGARRLSTANGMHSLWSPRNKAFGLYALGGSLYRLTPRGVGLASSLVLSGLTPSTRVKFYEYANEVFFTNGHELGVISDTGGRLLGLTEPPSAPTLSDVVGGMPPGRYACAYSFISPEGEESALSPAAFIDTISGGVAVELPAIFPANVTSARIYATLVNGDLLYMSQDVPVGTTIARVQNENRSQLSPTQLKSRMVGGRAVSVFNGVVYISDGQVLRHSDPFNYGITSKDSGFIPFGSQVLFHEPVVDGIYVGTTDGTYFLAGSGPTEFKQQLVGTGAVATDSISVPGAFVATSMEGQTDPVTGEFVAVWLGEGGFVLGYPGGTVKDVQAKRMALGDQGVGVLVDLTTNGVKKVVTLVEATVTRGSESASDSFI